MEALEVGSAAPIAKEVIKKVLEKDELRVNVQNLIKRRSNVSTYMNTIIIKTLKINCFLLIIFLTCINFWVL